MDDIRAHYFISVIILLLWTDFSYEAFIFFFYPATFAYLVRRESFNWRYAGADDNLTIFQRYDTVLDAVRSLCMLASREFRINSRQKLERIGMK